MNTIKTMKLEYRSLGTGWKAVDHLDVASLESFITLNKVQEYYIYEINIVTLDLEVIETEFKGVKYVALTERTLGSNKYDRDDTPVQQTSKVITTKEVEQVIEAINTNNKAEQTKPNNTKLTKTSFFIMKANGEKEYNSNGYEFILANNQKVIVHKVNDKWNTTMKENGLSIIRDISTRKEAINQTMQLMERIESFT